VVHAQTEQSHAWDRAPDQPTSMHVSAVHSHSPPVRHTAGGLGSATAVPGDGHGQHRAVHGGTQGDRRRHRMRGAAPRDFCWQDQSRLLMRLQVASRWRISTGQRPRLAAPPRTMAPSFSASPMPLLGRGGPGLPPWGSSGLASLPLGAGLGGGDRCGGEGKEEAGPLWKTPVIQKRTQYQSTAGDEERGYCRAAET
jgi:hypothetical protein